jgi:hypothetical protein
MGWPPTINNSGVAGITEVYHHALLIKQLFNRKNNKVHFTDWFRRFNEVTLRGEHLAKCRSNRLYIYHFLYDVPPLICD